MKCRDCAKIFCEYRDTEYNCENKITFTQAGIYDRPNIIDYDLNNYFNYGEINFEEAARRLEKIGKILYKMGEVNEKK
jgi:hypothetical protein